MSVLIEILSAPLELDTKELMLFNCSVGEDSWGSLGLQGDQTSQSKRKSTLNIHWKDWCQSSNTLATWCKEPTHLKRPWCWERLKVGEGDDRGWDGWMASLTQWTWVWASCGRWWRTGKPGVLQSMGSQRVGHNWATKQQQASEQSLSWRDPQVRHLSTWNYLQHAHNAYNVWSFACSTKWWWCRFSR